MNTTNHYNRNNPLDSSDDRDSSDDARDAWESQIGEALRAAVSTRADRSNGAGGSIYSLGDVLERVRVRARRRKAGRAGFAVAACVATVASVVGYRMLDDEPSRVVVVAEAGQDSFPAASAVADAAAASDDADAAVADAGLDSSPAASAVAVDAAADPDDLSAMLQQVSTAPPLDWSLVGTDLWSMSHVQSLGDGRVLVHGSVNTVELPQVDTRPVTLVTSDGRNFTEVNLPQEVSHDKIAADGDHWVVGGLDRTGDFSDRRNRLFASKDAGATWNEIDIKAAVFSLTTEWTMIRFYSIDLLMVSGDDIVVALGNLAEIDLAELAEDRGVVPEGKRVIGWSHSRLVDDESLVLILEPSFVDSVEGSVEGVDGDRPLYASETIRVHPSELGLTPKEQEDVERGSISVTRLLHSDGGTAEVTRSILDGKVLGTVTDSGFAVYLTDQEDTQGALLTSPDGRSWTQEDTKEDSLSFYRLGLTPDTVWSPISDLTGTTVIRAAHGGEAQEMATFDGMMLGRLNVGPAGLSTIASTNTELLAGAIEPPSFTATVARDGYELHYNDPPGGMTLVDQSTGQKVVAVIDLEDVLSSIETADSIDGVRATADGEIIFTDPETGDELVIFTAADMDAVQAQFEAGIAAAAAEQSERIYVTQDVIGWSADGADWAWQTLSDAFGVDDVAAWARQAVGEDYVVALVEEQSTSDSDEWTRRLFVAHTN